MRTAAEYGHMFETLREMVVRTRKKVESNWPTPDTESSIMYAVTESAEAIDAYLRMKRPGDARNNEKANDIRRELAQCLMMLLTAGHGLVGVNVESIIIMVAERMAEARIDLLGHALSHIQEWTARILPAYWNGHGLVDLQVEVGQATIAVLVTSDWADIDVAMALIEELVRVEAKWMV